MTTAEDARRRADLDLAQFATDQANATRAGLAHPQLDAPGREWLTSRATRLEQVAASLRDRHAA